MLFIYKDVCREQKSFISAKQLSEEIRLINAVCNSCFLQLQQLRLILSCLTMDSAKTLVHAFISSRLDYCNSLLVGAADRVIRKLQGVQNAASRLITGTRKYDHIIPILRDLHWLPVHQRIK